MPHPIYGPPSHELDKVIFTLHLPTARNGRRARLEVQGRSETQRGSLWSLTETWGPDEHRGGYEYSDAIHHIALAAAQDRCSTQSHLEASLRGEGWEQLSLPM